MQASYYTYLIIFLTGMLGIWKAVPIGFAFGSNPFAVWLLTVLGAIGAVLVIYFFGNKIRNFINKKKKAPRQEKRQARARQLFEKYGEAGLGLIGTLIMGPNMTLLVGLIIVPRPRKLLYFTILGILLWTFVLTVIAVISIDFFHRIVGH